MEIIFSIGPGQIDNASQFLGHFAGHLGQSLNSIYGRDGHFWSGRARVEEILTQNKAEKLIGYGACNVVKDGLVEKASHWKGFSTTEALANGKRLIFEYIDRTLWHKYREGKRKVDPKKYTKKIELKLTPAPVPHRHHRPIQSIRARTQRDFPSPQNRLYFLSRRKSRG